MVSDVFVEFQHSDQRPPRRTGAQFWPLASEGPRRGGGHGVIFASGHSKIAGTRPYRQSTHGVTPALPSRCRVSTCVFRIPACCGGRRSGRPRRRHLAGRARARVATMAESRGTTADYDGIEGG